VTLAEVVDPWQHFCMKKHTNSESGRVEHGVASGAICGDARAQSQERIG
jgi:hypothetical protein